MDAERKRWVSLAATSVGTLVEWFDFMVFAYLAPVLAPLFFPTHDKLASLLATYGLFWLGFAIRPLGGACIGCIGDLFGRRWTLLGSVILMSLPMLATGFLPTYAQIGFWAPALLAVTRLAMGFSVGGEFSGTVVALFETAAKGKSALAVNLANVSSCLGALLAAAAVTGLSALLGAEKMSAGGWRIPYFLGAGLAFGAILLRFFLHETPQFEETKKKGLVAKSPLRDVWRADKMAMAACAIGCGFYGHTYYLLGTYLPNRMETDLHLPGSVIFLAAVVANTCLALLPQLFAPLVDRVKWWPFLWVTGILTMVAVWPALEMVEKGGAGWVVAGLLLFAIPQTAFTSAILPAASALFPTPRRFTGMSVAYNIGMLAFAGPVPGVAAWLHAKYGTFGPAGMVVAMGVLTLLIVEKYPDNENGPSPSGKS
jgi:MHS family proline/betaine transporter-like MFS transporter